MEKTAQRTSCIVRFLCLLSFLMSAPLPAQSAESGYARNSLTDQKDNKPTLNMYTQTVIEYTDNVFRLSRSDQSKMEDNAVDDQASGRFEDMDSVSDYIVSPELGLHFDANSPVGGDFSLMSWMRFHYYTKNQIISYPEGKVRLKNSIGEHGELTLEGSCLFDFFKKNYLTGVNDANGNGNIPRSERIYASASYDEYEGLMAYNHTFINENNRMISGLDLKPFTGYAMRRYNSTFSNRDQDISMLGLGLNLECMSRVDLEMIGTYEWVSSPGDNELILFDETLTGADVNGDGRIKGNAPVVTAIDRSCSRYTLGVKPSCKISKDARIFAGYERRITTYDSSNRLDIEHYDQEACRQKISSGIKYNFSKAWSAEVKYTRTDEDEDAEDGDYTENSYQVKVNYSFMERPKRPRRFPLPYIKPRGAWMKPGILLPFFRLRLAKLSTCVYSNQLTKEQGRIFDEYERTACALEGLGTGDRHTLSAQGRALVRRQPGGV